MELPSGVAIGPPAVPGDTYPVLFEIALMFAAALGYARRSESGSHNAPYAQDYLSALNTQPLEDPRLLP